MRVLFILSCITLPIIEWLIMYIYCNLSSFAMAFTDINGNWSFDNFIRIYDEFTMETSKIREAFRNTFITFGVMVAAFPFQVLVSYFIYKKIPFHNFLRTSFFLPSLISAIAITMVFENVIGTESIIAETVAKLQGLDYTPELMADSRYVNTVIIIHKLWLTFPGDLIIWGGTFARIPEDVLESAQLDGVTWWTEFTKVIIPLIWPTFALKMILMLCGMFSSSGEVFLLSRGDYGTMTIPAWMQLELYNNSGNAFTSNAYNYMAAFGLVVSILAISVSLIVRKVTDKMFTEVEY